MFWECCFGNNFGFCVENSAQFLNLKNNFMNVFLCSKVLKDWHNFLIKRFLPQICFVFAIQICTSTKKAWMIFFANQIKGFDCL